jgi:hypothetical protein
MHTRLLRSRMVLLTSLVGCLSFFAAAPCAADAVSESYIRQHQPWSPQNMGLNALLWNRAKYLVTTEKLGRQRIDSGRATTTFQRLPGHLAPDAYAAQQQDPAERQKAALGCTQALQKFEEIAAKNHLNINDVADAYGLAFTMSYEVYSGGRQVNAAQRAGFIQQQRAVLMKNLFFQGSPDKERQLQTEKYGIDAVLASAQHAVASRTNDAVLRDSALRIAAQTLQELWSGPLGALELTSTGFGDRGERIIREGKATTRVALSPTPIANEPDAVQLWRDFVQYAQSNKVAVADYGQVQALALSINYEIYAGRALTDKQFQWAVREMSHDILGDATFQGSSAHDKQEVLEVIAIAAMSVAAELKQSATVAPEELDGPLLAIARNEGVDNASKARALADQARQAAKRNLAQLFAPRVFDNYVLAEGGFRPRTGAQR